MGGGRPERRINGEGRSYHPWRLGASILADPAEERLGWRLGKTEEVVGNFYAQGIEARRPEEEIEGRGGRERAQLGFVRRKKKERAE